MARIWTLAEADAALPRVRYLLAQVRQIRSDVLAEEAHLQDLVIVHGREVVRGGAGHDEWLEHRQVRQAAHARLHEILQRAQAEGIHVKDVDAGLVDFEAELGSRRVFLCWREGEARVAAWHPLQGGFAGRQPVPDAPAA